MHLLKQWFGFYVFSNVHVAIAAYCLTKITFLEFGFQNEPLALFVFFSATAGTGGCWQARFLVARHQ